MSRQPRTTSETIYIRFNGDDYALIEAAAKITGQTPKTFIINAARQRAVNVVLDQRVFPLSCQQAIDTAELFANPPAPNRQLIDLMHSVAPWEQAQPN